MAGKLRGESAFAEATADYTTLQSGSAYVPEGTTADLRYAARLPPHQIAAAAYFVRDRQQFFCR